MLIVEIGGQDEQIAAEYIEHQVKKGRKKPVAAFIAGVTAPPGRRMGHAGAIASGQGDDAAAKISFLQNHGITIAPTPAHIGNAMQKAMESI